MTRTIGSLFAGIGGFDLGFERAGFRTVWQCEIDKAAQGVLRRRFPDAKLHSDVREVGAHNLAPVDVLTFGSPCQDLSVAGKRAGLAGERSGLFHEAARIIRELRAAYGKPDFAIWENVPGAFSSNNGADFAAVVQTMVDLGARDVCWRVLDSRYFGVAQRRRRVFLVADFGGERAEQILFEPESLLGDFKKGGKARKEAAGSAGAGAAGGSYWDGGQLADTLDSSMAAKRQTMPEKRGFAAVLEPVAFAQNTRDEVRLMNGDGQIDGALAAQPGMKQTTYVAQPIPIQEVGKRTGVSTTDRRAGLGIGDPDDPMFTLQATAQHGVAQPIAFHPTQDPISSQDGVSHGMSNGSKNGQATVAVCATGGRTHALTVSDGATEDGTGRGTLIVPVPAVSGTLGGGSNTRGWSNDLDRSGAFIPTAAMQVRRLTPTECERLQGFTDGWTAEVRLPDGTLKQQADGPRYKQLGNAVTVNVAEWIARRVRGAL